MSWQHNSQALAKASLAGVWKLLAAFRQIYKRRRSKEEQSREIWKVLHGQKEPVKNISWRVWLLTPWHLTLAVPERQASVCRDTTGTETRNKQGKAVSENFQDRVLP